ncbi:RNA polymerase sigma factor [Marinimicrobium alkaliphilum]|uniref:RNA polymerase sigma factor n=1 Tax=Marinimicrobium alkaliphilum TaxID=2202654 RepID=UPI000DBA5FA1|nr:sigma-70 family RNA polymerase sigma factor [Marinimicrobium alkaliphilum]
MATDRELIERVLFLQDRHAYEQLVLRYQSTVRRWARRLCRGDSHAADDLAQETFIRGYTHLASFRAEARFSSWLYRIAFNLAVSEGRKQREWLSEDAIEEQAGHSSEQIDARNDLGLAMAQLSQAQQLTIRLSLEEGFTHEEIAEILGLPLGTVKTHINRGKQHLQLLLAPWRETAP